MTLGLIPPPGPTALLVSGEPGRFRETATALGRRGVRLRFAQDDLEVARGLARRPTIVLVDLTHRAALTRRAIERINRVKGRALVVALHRGTLDVVAPEFADLSVDGYCREESEFTAGLAASAYCPPPGAGPAVH